MTAFPNGAMLPPVQPTIKPRHRGPGRKTPVLINRNVLRALRVANGYSVRALADKLGIAHTTLARIENGDRNPSVAMAKRIADRLGVPLPELAREEGVA